MYYSYVEIEYVATRFSPTRMDLALKLLKNVKKSAHNESNVEDVMFKNLFSGDLKLKVAKNVNKSSKSNSIGVYITGPFYNSKTHNNHWIVVYGDNGNAWMLKSEFICGYISSVLPGDGQSIIDINHCHTYEDIHIHKDEFGPDSVWRCKPAPQDKRIRPSPGFHLSIPVTQGMRTLVKNAYLKQSNSSSCQWKSVI
jgi:hypothetical protein